MIPYDATELSSLVARNKATFTADFFSSRHDWGCQTAGPIFIVGLPRSGSTLLEQILASHSAVEGTMELYDIHQIARSLVGDLSRYPEALERLSADDFRSAGEHYLHRTEIQRKSGAPFFVDKMPFNWTYVGLIQLMLPGARIIDARRHPLACGLMLQAVLRQRTVLYVQPRRSRSLLPRLCRPDGALRRSASRTDSPRDP